MKRKSGIICIIPYTHFVLLYSYCELMLSTYFSIISHYEMFKLKVLILYDIIITYCKLKIASY